MISTRIVNSARFLQLPLEAQLLYFHMIVRLELIDDITSIGAILADKHLWCLLLTLTL